MGRFAGLACAALALAGCATPGPQRIPVAPQLKAAAVPVRISPADAARIDRYKVSWRQQEIQTGPIWASVFVGTGASPLLTITSTRLTVDLLHGAGWAPQLSYSVAATLRVRGVDYALQAVGTGSSGAGFGHPAETAVNEAVTAIARQAQAVISSLAQTPLSSR